MQIDSVFVCLCVYVCVQVCVWPYFKLSDIVVGYDTEILYLIEY